MSEMKLKGNTYIRSGHLGQEGRGKEQKLKRKGEKERGKEKTRKGGNGIMSDAKCQVPGWGRVRRAESCL